MSYQPNVCYKVEGVANIAGFFTNDLSRFANGQHLLVNGGANIHAESYWLFQIDINYPPYNPLWPDQLLTNSLLQVFRITGALHSDQGKSSCWLYRLREYLPISLILYIRLHKHPVKQ
jgi:hypothetical protein